MTYPLRSIALTDVGKPDVTEILRQAERQRAAYLASLLRGLFARLGHVLIDQSRRPVSSRG